MIESVFDALRQPEPPVLLRVRVPARLPLAPSSSQRFRQIGRFAFILRGRVIADAALEPSQIIEQDLNHIVLVTASLACHMKGDQHVLHPHSRELAASGSFAMTSMSAPAMWRAASASTRDASSGASDR